MIRHLRITGVVQGVGYRASFEAQARQLGLAGWVRNRRDGSVEAVVSGPDDSIEAIVNWAQVGPAMARVDQVEISEPECPALPDQHFEIRARA